MDLTIAAMEAADTFLMAALVFCGALIIRKEIAGHLLAIMALLAAISLAGRTAGLHSLVRVLNILIASAPIILAIIFQGDLRRALLLSTRRNPAPETEGDGETIEELLKALREMAEKRIGALIVLVRHIPLGHIIQVGTEIDAKVTSELLNSIFLPYSPIHDGAVIIETGKLTKAGCLLPLSQNPDIAKSFGTRHRAALGLSELCDCCVVVVSEETGKISLVHDARITYDLDYNDLRRELKKALDFRRHP